MQDLALRQNFNLCPKRIVNYYGWEFQYIYIYCSHPSSSWLDEAIEINWHFIKEKLDIGLIAFEYVPLVFRLVGIFTRGLPTELFQGLTCKLRMIDIHTPARGGLLYYIVLYLDITNYSFLLLFKFVFLFILLG